MASLTDQAIARLRSYADGNGLTPDSIQLIEQKETVHTVSGTVRLTPKADTSSQIYNGPVRNKGRTILPDFASLHQAILFQQQKFTSSSEWIPIAMEELKKTPGYGWGLHDAKIELPEQSYIFAASEECRACRSTGQIPCVPCQGLSTILCPYCQARGQEICPNCFGKGENPVNPGHPCPICHGRRFANCRFCNATGRQPCPDCQGRGGVPCPDCRGAGKITQETAVNCSADVNFQITGGGNLPSGLLRMLDRIDPASLVKKHADIEIIKPAEDEEKEKPELKLQAKVPYADIKLRLGKKAVQFLAFGKRCLLSGVPAFLDTSLQPWRDRLAEAARGKAPIEKALEARAMRDALSLYFNGQQRPDDLRRLYTVGLSPNVTKEIMRNIDKALRSMTVRVRALAAFTCFVLSATLFAVVFFTPLRAQIMQGPPPIPLLIDIFLPVLVLTLSWFSMRSATRWLLTRRFSQATIRAQKIGKIGYGSLAAIAALYALLIAHTRFLLFQNFF